MAPMAASAASGAVLAAAPSDVAAAGEAEVAASVAYASPTQRVKGSRNRQLDRRGFITGLHESW